MAQRIPHILEPLFDAGSQKINDNWFRFLDSLANDLASTWRVLASSGIAVSHTGDTSETVLATVQVPANAMGPNGILRISSLWSYTNSGNNKTSFIRLGGLAGTAFLNRVHTASASFFDVRQIANRDAANSQVGPSVTLFSVGESVNAAFTGTINTTVAQDLVLTGQLASAGETITLEAYLVELLKAA